jgi:hypothetical protein
MAQVGWRTRSEMSKYQRARMGVSCDQYVSRYCDYGFASPPIEQAIDVLKKEIATDDYVYSWDLVSFQLEKMTNLADWKKQRDTR